MIPRVLDVGRCNDSYFAIRIAKELAEATGKNITELPEDSNVVKGVREALEKLEIL